MSQFFISIHSISIVYPTPTYFYASWPIPGQTGRLVPQDGASPALRLLLQSRPLWCLSVLSCRIRKWANQRECQVEGNSKRSFPKKTGEGGGGGGPKEEEDVGGYE